MQDSHVAVLEVLSSCELNTSTASEPKVFGQNRRQGSFFWYLLGVVQSRQSYKQEIEETRLPPSALGSQELLQSEAL